MSICKKMDIFIQINMPFHTKESAIGDFNTFMPNKFAANFPYLLANCGTRWVAVFYVEHIEEAMDDNLSLKVVYDKVLLLFFYHALIRIRTAPKAFFPWIRF